MAAKKHKPVYICLFVGATVALKLLLGGAETGAFAVTLGPGGSSRVANSPRDTPTPTATISPTPFPQCGLYWRAVSSPNASNDNYLQAVAAVSPDDVWAVGYYYSGGSTHTLTMHWDGAQWSVVPSPDMGPLYAVVAMAADHLWAVGTMGTHPNLQTLIMHWDGMQWDMMPSPNVGAFDNILYGVTTISEDDAWAVGQYYNEGADQFQTLTLHWRGADWVAVPSPNTGTAENKLNAVSASSANDVWAVGTYLAGTEMVIMHWDGLNWSIVPGLGAGYLAGVTAISGDDVWAVGTGGVGGQLAMHWDGAGWSEVPTPPVTGGQGFNAVAATSSDDVWAVGLTSDGIAEHTLVEHWNGSAWSVSPSASLGNSINFLYGVAASEPSDAWAVGYYSSGGASFTQVLHFSDPCASPTATYTPTNTAMPIATATATPTSAATSTTTPTPCAALTPFAEGFESGTLNTFGSQVAQCSTGGCGWRPVTTSVQSGVYSAFAPNVSSISDQRMFLSTPVVIPANAQSATLSFWHKHVFDADAGNYYDGAVLEFSTNGGALWTDVLSSTTFIAGGYTGQIIFGHFNPLARRQAWGGYNASYPNFEPVVVNLLPFAGQGVQFRFRLGTDHVVGAQGWWIDDIQVNVALACPTATATPAGTPPVLVGHVTWQGPPAQPSSRQQLPITLTLKSDAFEVNYPSQATDASGFFTVSLAGLPGGTYTWRAKGPKYLANAGTTDFGLLPVPKSKIQNPKSLEMGLMRAGDANNDNIVNTTDFNILRASFGKALGDPGYDPRADFNSDDTVNITDVNLEKINFGQSGAPPVGPK
jgi:hypothetical protein